MDEHLNDCAECRREAFYFSEVGSLVGRVEQVSVRPDFNLRLRASIQRHEAEVAQPRRWYQWQPAPAWRLAIGVCSVLALFAVSYGSYQWMNPASPQAAVTVLPAPETAWHTEDAATRFESSPIVEGWNYPQGWTEIDPATPEGLLAQDRYLAAQRGPGEYVLETVRLDDPMAKTPEPNYLMPLVRSDQVVQKVSY